MLLRSLWLLQLYWVPDIPPGPQSVPPESQVLKPFQKNLLTKGGRRLRLMAKSINATTRRANMPQAAPISKATTTSLHLMVFSLPEISSTTTPSTIQTQMVSSRVSNIKMISTMLPVKR